MTDWKKKLSEVAADQIAVQSEDGNDKTYPQPPADQWFDTAIYSCEYNEESSYGPMFLFRLVIIDEDDNQVGDEPKEYVGSVGYHNMWLNEDRIDRAMANLATMGISPPEGDISNEDMAKIISETDTSSVSIRAVVGHFGDNNEKWGFNGISVKKKIDKGTPSEGAITADDATADPF